MEYTDPIRRRSRALRQFAVAAAQPHVLSRGVAVGTYWWVAEPNFGDDLTQWILPRYGVVPVHRRAPEARLAAVGSILEVLEPDYDGAVWGSGLILDQPYPLPNAKVLAVRGYLTRERIGARPDVTVGDPGLLVSRRIRRPAKRWDVGLVPHGSHRGHSAFARLAQTPALRTHVIDVRGTASRTVRQIAACDVILTTSLHGLVVADAFGIPALWTQLEPPLGGGDFKFLDYESVVTPHSSRFTAFDERAALQDLIAQAVSAPRSTIERVCDDLEVALARLPEVLGDLPRFPRGIPQILAGQAPSPSG